MHLLKKDASQLGSSARKALKLLDQSADLPHNPITIQSFEDRYTEWKQVEQKYGKSVIQRDESGVLVEADVKSNNDKTPKKETLEEMTQDLSLSSEDFKNSPIFTPPLSPIGSGPQSTKTSPEMCSATLDKHEATPIPPVLRPLINCVVWYANENQQLSNSKNVVFLTNSADAAQIAKDFAIVPKTIHQLRASITIEDSPQKTTPKSKGKKSRSSSTAKPGPEQRTLFSYEEDSSDDDEEVVFRPRSRDRPPSTGRCSQPPKAPSATHSPSNSISIPVKPQVPVEEIDPDSFDRGTFAYSNTPLANVGNYYGPRQFGGRGGPRSFSSTNGRGNGQRGNGFRGRGQGRLFVP